MLDSMLQKCTLVVEHVALKQVCRPSVGGQEPVLREEAHWFASGSVCQSPDLESLPFCVTGISTKAIDRSDKRLGDVVLVTDSERPYYQVGFTLPERTYERMIDSFQMYLSSDKRFQCDLKLVTVDSETWWIACLEFEFARGRTNPTNSHRSSGLGPVFASEFLDTVVGGRAE